MLLVRRGISLQLAVHAAVCGRRPFGKRLPEWLTDNEALLDSANKHTSGDFETTHVA
jgi:hypothetical protein